MIYKFPASETIDEAPLFDYSGKRKLLSTILLLWLCNAVRGGSNV